MGTREIVAHYVQNVSAEDNRLRFSNAERAAIYLSFLRGLGLLQREIQLVSGQPTRWKRELQLRGRFHWKPAKGSQSSTLSVEPVFTNCSLGGVGFKFLMIMTAIVADQVTNENS